MANITKVSQSRFMPLFSKSEDPVKASVTAATTISGCKDSSGRKMTQNHQQPKQQQQLYHFIPPDQIENAMQLHPAHAQYRLPRAATAVTPTGRKITIPIDERIYKIETPLTDLNEMPSEGMMHLLESERPESCTSSPRPLRDLRRQSDDESDGSGSCWPGDDDISDTEISEATDVPEIDTSFDYETRQEVWGCNEHDKQVFLSSIENVIKNLVNIENAAVHQNNSASASLSKESNTSVKTSNDVPEQITGTTVIDSNKHVAVSRNETDCVENVLVKSQVTEPIAQPESVGNYECGTGETFDSMNDIVDTVAQLAVTSEPVCTSTPKKNSNQYENVPLIDTQCTATVPQESNIYSEPAMAFTNYQSTFASPHGVNGVEYTGLQCCSYIYQTSDIPSGQYIQSMVVDEYGNQNIVNIPVRAMAGASPMMSPAWYETTPPEQITEEYIVQEPPVQSELPRYTHFIHEAFPSCQTCMGQDQLDAHQIQGELVQITDASAYSDSFSTECPYDPNIISTQCAYGYIDSSTSSQVAEYVEIGHATGPEVLGTGLIENPSQEISIQQYCSCAECNAQITGNEAEMVINNCVAENSEQQSSSSTNSYSTEQCSPTDSQLSGFIDADDGLPYPALHVTDDGLMTVILRKGVYLEMTAEKSIRLVNHEKKLVVSMNENGSRACVIHPSARICQSETTVNTDLFFGRRAKLTTEIVMFGNRFRTYKFDYNMVSEVTGIPAFRDLSQDESVDFLVTGDTFYKDDLSARCHDIISRAYFQKHQTTGSKVIINGVKVVQNDNGDVSVYIGPIKFMRMSPTKSILRLKSQFVEIDIEANWNVKITRGSHALNASHLGFIVSNGKIKATLDSNNNFQAFSLPEHRSLMLGQPIPAQRRRPGVGQKRKNHNGCGSTEPEGDHSRYQRTESAANNEQVNENEDYETN